MKSFDEQILEKSMKSGGYKHFRRKGSEETVVVDIVVVDNFVVDFVVVVVGIIRLLKQLFWQPSKQQRPNGSCASLVGQSTSLVPVKKLYLLSCL